MHELVQQEPPGAGDPDLLGLLASVGIVHGKPFEPDARMRKILEEAVVVGNATARTVTFAARPEEGFAFYPDSAWESALFVGGYEFLDPPPQITADGAVATPSDGARKLNSRTNFFYMATGITPAMCMRLTGIGSQYIYACATAKASTSTARRNYRLTLPPDIPESRFWSVILYDRQTRSMLQTDQHLPRLGSQSGTVETNPDGSTDIYFGPTAPDGKESNWLQTVPGKGWWTILRLYNPLQPFFDKSWRPSEIEPVELDDAEPLVRNNVELKGRSHAQSTSETPVLDLLASMTADSLEASSLDAETLMLVRIAALVAVDAPTVSYLMNLEAASETASTPSRSAACSLRSHRSWGLRGSRRRPSTSSTPSTSRSRSRSSTSKARSNRAGRTQ